MAVEFHGVILRNRRDVLQAAQETLSQKGVIVSIRELANIAKRGQLPQSGKLEASCGNLKTKRHRGKMRVALSYH